MRVISAVATIFVGAPVLLMLLTVGRLLVRGDAPASEEPRPAVERRVVAPTAAVIASPTPDPRPGSPAVYQRIAGLRDCAALQKEFDTAAATGDRERAASRIDMARLSTSYMDAADARMRQLGCN